MPFPSTKDPIAKLFFFASLFTTGIILNGYFQVYCTPSRDAKIVLSIVAISVLMSTLVKQKVLEFFVFIGLGIGLLVNIYLMMLWGETLLWGIIWIIPWIALFIMLLVLGSTSWTLLLGLYLYQQTGNAILSAMGFVLPTLVIWQVEQRKKIWLQPLMTIPLSISLVPFMPVILTWDSISLYLKGTRTNRIAFWIGIAILGSITAWKYQQYQRIARIIEDYPDVEIETIAIAEKLEKEPYFEKLLGVHMKYHTQACVYDGRRPPIHDPWLVLFYRNGNYPKVLADLELGDRWKMHLDLFRAERITEECSCTYFIDQEHYWTSNSFQWALGDSIRIDFSF
ncbi:MAG: hypothetical protein GY810_31190 [Aureispira sp.]|nr:hypothetical protein [Aureispira sp.]